MSKRLKDGETRTSIVIPTELLKSVRILADTQGQTMNGFLVSLLQAVVDNNIDTVKKFQSARQEAKAAVFANF